MEESIMRTTNYFAVLIFFVILGIGVALAYSSFGDQANTEGTLIIVISFFIALIISSAIKVADQWEKAVVLRLGRFHSLKGPGLFFIAPVIDNIPYWIDIRVITTSFTAEKTLTKDTVPVNVDAVLFWKVVDPKKAALDVAEYKGAISWASQTALVMSSARPCFLTCWKAERRLVTSCRRSLMCAPSHGGLMLFRWKSRMS